MNATKCMQPRRAFEIADRQQLQEQSLIGAWLMLVLIPAGVSLDYFVYNDCWVDFFGYRVAADIVVLASIPLHKSAFGRSKPEALVAIWLGVAIVMICTMIYVTDGSKSTYYAGLVLALLAIGILLPLRSNQAVIFCVATLVLYAAACFGPYAAEISTPDLFNNVYFLILACLISVTAVHFNARRRYKQFTLQNELEDRNVQLADLDRMKSNFFANVSHELRTPLTLILAPVQDLLARVEARSSELREPLQTINTSALRLLRLVNDLLDLLGFEQGGAILDRTKVDLGGLLAGLVDEIGHLAKQQNLTLQLHLPTAPLFVYANEDAVERVFLNLLSNAIKFTEPGGRLEVKGQISGCEAWIRVSDTGIGIALGDQAKIFDRFQQGDQSSTRRSQGLGLGLALVKELVVRQGGQVELDSKLGIGTTMLIQLPLFQGQNVVPAEAKPDGLALTDFHRQASRQGGFVLPAVDQVHVTAEQAPVLHTRKLVLIADDDINMQKYLSQVVGRDFEVLQAFDGEGTLAKALQFKPDLIVLDLMLPGKDGIEVCRTLKSEEQLGNSKIIMLTARIDEEAKISALRNGADDFISKPFNSVELVTRLKNLARSSTLEQEVRERNKELEATLKQLGETEAQLVHSERLNSLGTMAAGLLHEINNPLNFMGIALKVGFKRVESLEDMELKEILTDIYDGHVRIGTVISDLRGFATPQVPQSRKPFRLGTAVQHSLRFTASETIGLQVNTDIAENHITEGNEQLIIQVLVNLILNAACAIKKRKHSKSGRIEIGSSLQGQHVSISVRDNGCGIANDELSRIFDPFYTTQDVGQGMGLGLAISYGIIKNHGGELTVISELDRYSEFRFDLKQAGQRSEKEQPYVTEVN